MLSDTTRAVVLEALELLGYRVGYLRPVSGGMQWMHDVTKRASIDAAIAEVSAETEWEPIVDGAEAWGTHSISVEAGGAGLIIRKGKTRLFVALPENVRFFKRTGSQSEAQDG